MSKAAPRTPEKPGIARRITDLGYGLWFGSVFASLALVTLCFIAVTPGQERRRGLARWGARGVFRLSAAWPVIEGLDSLPSTPSVVVANHASYLDGVLLTAILPSRYRFVIKREVTQVPVMNFFLQRIGAHFVERFDKHKGANDTRRIIQTANNGASLAFFPEGTFRTEPGLRRFHSGAFKIAVRGQMPLIPLRIEGTRHMLPADRMLPRPAKLSIRIDSPVATAGDVGVPDALEQCRKRILHMLDEPDLADAG